MRPNAYSNSPRVSLVFLVGLVNLVQPNSQDRLNRPDRRDRPMNNAGGRNVVFFVRARGWMIIRRLLDVSIYRILLLVLLSLCLLDLGPISHRELPSRFRSLSRVDFLHMWQSNCESDSLRTDRSSLPAYASRSAISPFLSVRIQIDSHIDVEVLTGVMRSQRCSPTL